MKIKKTITLSLFSFLVGCSGVYSEQTGVNADSQYPASWNRENLQLLRYKAMNSASKEDLDSYFFAQKSEVDKIKSISNAKMDVNMEGVPVDVAPTLVDNLLHIALEDPSDSNVKAYITARKAQTSQFLKQSE